MHVDSIFVHVRFKIRVDLAHVDLKAIQTVEEPFIFKLESNGRFMLFKKRVKWIFYEFRMCFNIKDNRMGKYVGFFKFREGNM